MLGYVTLGANDFERAKAFYRAALAPLGARPAMSGPDPQARAGRQGRPRPDTRRWPGTPESPSSR